MYNRIKKLFAIKGYGLLLTCMLLVGIGFSITQPYLPLYCTENLGMSPGAFGTFMAVSLLSGVLLNSFIAKRSDNGLDRKWIIILSMLSSALGYALILIFHNFFILLIVFSLCSGLGAASMPQIFAYAQESANESKSDDKVFAISALRSLISVGFLIGPLGGALILGFAGFQGLYIGASILYLIIAALVFLFLQNRKTSEHNTKEKESINSSSLKRRHIWQPFLAFILLFAINTINGTNTPLFIMNNLHGTHGDIGLMVSISAGLEIPVILMFGALGKKISSHALMIYSCLIAFVYYVILTVSTNSWQLIAAQLLQAMFVAIIMGNGLSYFNDILPNSPGISATLYTNASNIGRLAGNLGWSVIAEFAGFRDVYWVCLGIAIFSFFILWRTKSYEKIKIQTKQTNLR